MTTYSNLGIKLMETGAESGTWGASTNTNFEYFDTAIVGFVSVPVTATGTTSSPNVLDVANFAESNGRNRIVHFTSVTDLAATVYVRVTPDSFKGYYFIRNSLLGGRSLVVFQGVFDAGRAYTIPNGKDAILRCDGLGNIASVVHVFNNIYNNSITTNTFTTNTFTATNISANNITATNKFVGPGTGLTGTANGLAVNYTTSATTATATTNSAVTLTAANALHFPTWVTGTSGNLPLKVSNTKLNFNPSLSRLNLVTINAGSVTNTAGSTSSSVTTTNISVTEAIPTFTGTGAIKIPTGTSAQRPSGPTVGMVRYNTSTGAYEVYTGTAWESLALGSIPSSTGLGINQQWRNVTASRVVGSSYPSNYGAPMQVMITIQGTNTSAKNFFFGNNSGWNMVYIDVNEAAANTVYVRRKVCWVSIIPYALNAQGNPLYYYGVSNASGSVQILSWYELW